MFFVRIQYKYKGLKEFMSILKLETPQKSQQAVDALYQVLENRLVLVVATAESF